MKKFFWPNKDTKKFISMSINPGNTGANLHNRLFQIYKLNNIYIPLKISTIKQAKQILKILILMDVLYQCLLKRV